MTDICNLNHSQAAAFVPEYVIYAYKGFDENKVGCNHWKLMGTMRDSKIALESAEALFLARKYDKVEIRKKAFNKKKNMYVSSTFHVFGNERRLSPLLVGGAIGMVTLIVGFLSYFMYNY